MEQPDREAEPHFSHPVRQIIQMLIVLGFTGVITYIALPSVLPVFTANPYLNGFIVFVFFIGVIACFLQVLSLIASARWIKSFALQNEDFQYLEPPRLLVPLASLLRSRGARGQISATSTRSILDSVATRIDEGREITRYIVNMLIFLGLLGTFYGLATTVPAVVDTIRSLAPTEGEEGLAVFQRLMTGLESQLSGMGIAFASSLLGLAGSLVVGLLELFAGQGQNRFYRELEEWLSSITRVGFSAGEGEHGIEHNVLGEVLEHMAEQMDQLQQMFTKAEESRTRVEGQVGALTQSVSALTQQLGTETGSTAAMSRVAEGQERLIEVLQNQGTGEGVDAESRMRLRSIDVQMLRILEEISAGRQDTITELRTDLSALTRAITLLGEKQAVPRRRKPTNNSSSAQES
ncbi:biopolymer transporter ExbB [Cognatishimia sp. 1_MG-2023]|uniref:biopolymer transporter ExbB n=1 Tax=Cognatishimia sp. 1_MG-2023 TaxID=3062642 RepID=UPI0026E3437F|nr:biopolymer transporter ExbB [Cognatishimia sp. 1_MG-2023]MDO6725793.1 biopolymer transporter ExbB [Cognatishimia sp. 1_MG-2023]